MYFSTAAEFKLLGRNLKSNATLLNLFSIIGFDNNKISIEVTRRIFNSNNNVPPPLICCCVST